MLGHILEGCRYVYLFVLFGFWLFALLLVREKNPRCKPEKNPSSQYKNFIT